jgi:methyl-accepting chemotaxis protein
MKKLSGLKTIKRIQIERFFAERVGDANVLAHSPYVREAYRDLSASFAQGGPFQGFTKEEYEAPIQYKAIHDRYFPYFKHYMEQYSYYDVFLMTPDNGDVVFTVTKESDFGQRTAEVESSLRDVWTKAVREKRTVLSDMKPYEPSAGAPAIFVASPILSGESVTGVVALQISIDAINAIMTERTGMGETGETYLVGQDLLMRSDSYLDPKNHTVTASFADPEKGKADTAAVRAALDGKTDTRIIIDYNGNPVLSAYAPVTVGDTTWAILAEKDVAEALCPKDEQGVYFFSKYKEMYGYYDLFLINPDGYCFFTVTHEADYQTNLVDGKYASSNLGQLVRKVIQTGRFGFADFAPYAPSNDDPASFIAQPVVTDGNVELVIALQMSLESIGHIMQQRAGMGETGETYLVGSDNRMRSDSFLDPEGHSVQASFAGTVEKNGVDSVATKEALSGKTGSQVIIDYNGNPVLSAYAPLDVFGNTWALLAEIDEAEVKAPIVHLQILVGMFAALLALLIAGLAAYFAISITRPLDRGVQFLSQVAEGDLTADIDVDQKDEVGMLANAMKSMARKLLAIVDDVRSASENVSSGSHELASTAQSLAQGATEQASSIQEVNSSVDQLAAKIHDNTENAHKTEIISAEAASEAEESSAAIAGAMESLRSIAEKISIIEEIARQTNLLALNAAIEAARAGEAGKGFAVVASEVRKLAERSGNAAAEISQLSTNTVDASDAAGQKIQALVPTIRQTAELVQEIAAASEEQNTLAIQISRAIPELDIVVQNNASTSEEMAATAEELSGQAESLRNTINFFKIEDTGGTSRQTMAITAGSGGRAKLGLPS